MKKENIISIIALVSFGVFLLVLWINGKISSNPGTWIAAFLTLCIYSFLYRDNVFYKFAEHLLIGVTNGYYISIIFYNAMMPKIIEPIFINRTWIVEGHVFSAISIGKLLLVVVPTCMGLLMFSRFVPKYAWLIRFPLAFIMGVSCGLSILPSFQASIFEQVAGTFKSSFIVRTAEGIDVWHSLGVFLMIFGVIVTLVYFFFSMEHKGIIGGTARIGIWFIMAGFGASFGYTIMARVSLLIGRVQFLLHDWIKLIN